MASFAATLLSSVCFHFAACASTGSCYQSEDVTTAGALLQMKSGTQKHSVREAEGEEAATEATSGLAFLENRTREAAVDHGISFLVDLPLWGEECEKIFSKGSNAMDALKNFAYSPQLQTRVMPAIERIRDQCAEWFAARVQGRLAAAQAFVSKVSNKRETKAIGTVRAKAFAKFAVALQDIVVVHEVMGFPRHHFQATVNDVCRTLSAAFITSSKDAAHAVDVVYKGRWSLKAGKALNWSSRHASDRIEELEDFIISFTDMQEAGLDWDDCLAGWKVPRPHLEFVKTLQHIRPYPRPAELIHRKELLGRIIMFVTHLVYHCTNFATRAFPAEMLEPERLFMRETLSMLPAEYDIDSMGELIDCLLLLGDSDDDPLIQDKRSRIVARQHADGSWNTKEGSSESYGDMLHATYNGLNGIIYHDWLRLSRSADMSINVMRNAEYDRALQLAGLIPLS